MSKIESFTIETGAGELRGVVHRPDDVRPGVRLPCVLMYRGLHVERTDATPMLDALAEAISNLDHVVISWEPRATSMILEDFQAYSLADERSDAGCVMRWLKQRGNVDAEHVSIVAYSLGAMTSLWLAREHHSIRRLSLVAPASSEHVTDKLAKDPEHDPRLQELPGAYVQALRDSGAWGVEGLRCDVQIVHGSVDQIIPVEVAQRYEELFEQAGRVPEALIAARADHAFERRDVRAVCIERIVQFITAPLTDEAMAGA